MKTQLSFIKISQCHAIYLQFLGGAKAHGHMMKLLYIAPSLPLLLHLDMRRGRPAETRAASAQVVMPDPAESLRCSGEVNNVHFEVMQETHVMIWDAIFELSRWYSWWNLSHYLHTGFDTSQVCRIQYFRGQLIRPTSSHLIQPNSRLLLRFCVEDILTSQTFGKPRGETPVLPKVSPLWWVSSFFYVEKP